MKHFFLKQSQFSVHSGQQNNKQSFEQYYNSNSNKNDYSPSFNIENAKIHCKNESQTDDELYQTDGQSTFCKTEQSKRFSNTYQEWFKNTSLTENNQKFQGSNYYSNVSTPNNSVRPKAISLTTQTSGFLSKIKDLQLENKLKQGLTSGPSSSTSRYSQAQKKQENSQFTASVQIQNKKNLRKKKQEKIVKQAEKVLKEIEVRKLTFTTFGFKAQEKAEDPLLQFTINKMVNTNKSKGSMFVTDLWPESNVKQFISYQRMHQGKYIMRKIAQQAFKQSTENYHSQPKTLTRKDEEGVYYFFKDNAPNDNRQQKQIHSVFQSKDSKYQNLIKKFVPKQDEENELLCNSYKYDPNTCSEIIERIYQQNDKDNQLNQCLSYKTSLNNNQQSLIKDDLKRQTANQSPQEKRQSMMSYANKFKFQKINKNYLFFSHEDQNQNEKESLKNMIVEKIIEQESNRIDDLSQTTKRKQSLDSNFQIPKSKRLNTEYSNKISKIFDSINQFQTNKKNLKDKKDVENLSRQLNYAVFKSVERNLLHKDDQETWGEKNEFHSDKFNIGIP